MTNWLLIPTLATLVIAIFGASWLSQQMMNKRIDDLKMYLDARFEAVNARFDAIEQRIGLLEQRVELFARFLPKSGDEGKGSNP
jgi:hypothetical protein